MEYCPKCGREPATTVHICIPGTSILPPPGPPVDLPVFTAPECPGCGTNYLITGVNPLHPHVFAECAAYRRGFNDGYQAGINAANNVNPIEKI